MEPYGPSLLKVSYSPAVITTFGRESTWRNRRANSCGLTGAFSFAGVLAPDVVGGASLLVSGLSGTSAVGVAFAAAACAATAAAAVAFAAVASAFFFFLARPLVRWYSFRSLAVHCRCSALSLVVAVAAAAAAPWSPPSSVARLALSSFTVGVSSVDVVSMSR